MPKIEFFIDFRKDLDCINNSYPQMRRVFSRDFNRLLKRYYPFCVNKSDEDILEYFKENKRKITKQTNIHSDVLKAKWTKINNEFFDQIEKITGFQWKYKIYRCYLSSSYICGGGYALPRTIIIFPQARHIDPLNSIAHEITHLHLWDILEKTGLKIDEKTFTNKKIWDISEVIVNFPLLKLKIEGFNYKMHLFPQQKKLYMRLKPLYKDNFKEFIRKCVKYIHH